MDWQPISEACLRNMIVNAEGRMSPSVLRLWEAIRIPPQKWSEKTYGEAGGGFWVVAIIGNRVIWYNDIEDGFNCSAYVAVGSLVEYHCTQDKLEMAVQAVLTIIETGIDSTVRRATPIAVEWRQKD